MKGFGRQMCKIEDNQPRANPEKASRGRISLRMYGEEKVWRKEAFLVSDKDVMAVT